ncbi:response regulator [Alkalicoccus urumqiensis]|uniref:Two-component system response regulator n=1 Tax=Alkalicoccus urumqiensis TaxID=1548213 RepID=A0A2P6MLW7_ALKUR|nr:response regulator [Alkalicoccus urumqiensis]PRO67230.1 two-component system response regulator [Alkalicoccus urumqiensis]
MTAQSHPDTVRVLLIEDDPMVQEVNKLFIEKVPGFTVTGVAANGTEGRRMIRDMDPDLVLLDIFMPQENGLETLTRLREEEEDVDIIAITAANDGETIKKLLRLGAVDYILKPFTFERLQQALTKYRQLADTLRGAASFSQEDIDQAAFAESPPVEKQLPKGLHRKTLDHVVAVLKQHEEPRTTEEIAEDVGMARVTVRRYLQFLEETGSAAMTMNYGTIGRPVQQYRWQGGA